MGAHVSVPLYQRSVPQRYRMEGARCNRCEELVFPPRAVCPHCGGSEWTTVALKGRGRIYSYTVIAAGGAPPEFGKQAQAMGEYAVAIVAMEEGPRVVAQVVDVAPRNVTIGMPVESVFRQIYSEEGVTRYGFKFRPAMPEEEAP